MLVKWAPGTYLMSCYATGIPWLWGFGWCMTVSNFVLNCHCYSWFVSNDSSLKKKTSLTHISTHWDRDKMASIFENFQIHFPWWKLLQIYSQLTSIASDNEFTWTMTGHYLNQWWPSLLMHLWVTWTQFLSTLLIMLNIDFWLRQYHKWQFPKARKLHF